MDETRFLKKGVMPPRAARMYTGTAGRVENRQIGVFLAYAAPHGSRALIDRELHLPQKRTGDRDRCRAAGIGDDVAFATKPELVQKMIARAANARVPFAWVAGDAVYDGNRGLREWLEERGIFYVMAVACSEMVTSRPDRSAGGTGGARACLRLAVAQLRRWVQGPRLYDRISGVA